MRRKWLMGWGVRGKATYTQGRLSRHKLTEQSQSLGIGLLQRPLATGSGATLSGGLEHHGQAHGGEQI